MTTTSDADETLTYRDDLGFKVPRATVQVDSREHFAAVRELRDLRAEVAHLREQRDHLQASNTRLVEERRGLDWTAQLRHMFAAFEQVVPERPGFPDAATVKLRRKLLVEETQETLDALAEGDLVEVADGCIDVCVVALGMLLAFGIDPRPLWAEVLATNLAKAGGPKSADGKAMKPPGWKPPAIADLLVAQGWSGPKEAA